MLRVVCSAMWVGDERWCPRMVTGEKDSWGVIGVVGERIEVVGGVVRGVVGGVVLSVFGVEIEIERGEVREGVAWSSVSPSRSEGNGAAIAHSTPSLSTESCILVSRAVVGSVVLVVVVHLDLVVVVHSVVVW